MEAGAFVQELYRLALGREVDDTGLAGWTEMIERGVNPMQVLEGILGSEEYRCRHHVPAMDANLRSVILDRLRRHTLNIVDVGAQKLGSEDHVYNPLCEAGLAYRIVGFEPLADKLTERVQAEDSGSLVMLPHAIGDGEKHTLFINNDDATSSLYELDQEFCADFEHIRTLRMVEKRDIKTSFLDEVLPNTNEPIDFLKLDIQGAELMALKGAELALARTAVIHCEVGFSAIYKGQPLFPEIQSLLNQHGFDLIDILVPHRYSYAVPSGTKSSDRLIWADAVFFRRSDDELVRASQALTSLVVYKKVTLAEHLMTVNPACLPAHDL